MPPSSLRSETVDQYRSRHLNQIKTLRAIHILRENLSDIPDVQSWADETGYSRNWLIIRMKEMYSKTPTEVLRSCRYEAILTVLTGNIDQTAYSIAVECGLRDEVSLSKFLRKYYDTTLSELKVEIYEKRTSPSPLWISPDLTNGK